MFATGRRSGILLPVFSLRSKRDFGIGDFGALPAFFEWMQSAGQRVWMTLPLLPTAPGDSSPYSTRCAFGLNPLFIDLSAVPEFVDSGAEAGLDDAEQAQLAQARAAHRIRYPLVFALKARGLRRAFDHFERTQAPSGSGRARSFDAYREAQADWLLPFATFCALSGDQRNKPWWEWPQALREHRSEAVAAEASRLKTEVRFHAWQQWIAEEQWAQVRVEARRRGILLCGDEPFIIGKDSVDAWTRPRQLRCDARLGAPPDDFSATGQDWGLPYFDFPEMERDGMAWLKARAKKAASYYDLRRVDHAVGYFRQWIRDAQAPAGHFIPPDESTHQALGERNFRLLSEGTGIVAEDLGVIPSWVRETLTRLGLPGYRVLRWERENGVFRNPHQFPALSLTCTGTHDTETLREWWQTRENWERQAVARAFPEFAGVEVAAELSMSVHNAWLSAAENAGSDLCILPWQDVLGSAERINLPGSMSDDNWSYRMTQHVEDLLEDSTTQPAAQWLLGLARRGRRIE